MNEFILFEGNRGIINLDKIGRYITMHKSDKPDIWYDFDLKDGVFHKHKNFKTKPTEVTEISIEKITGWFYKHRIVTSDIKFAKLILFNKYNAYLDQFQSPVRFIEGLSTGTCMALEQWEGIGIKVKEAENLMAKLESGDLKTRGRYWNGDMGWFSFEKKPSQVDKQVIQYIKDQYEQLGPLDIKQINALCRMCETDLNVLNKLRAKAKNIRYRDLFHYEQWGNVRDLLYETYISFSLSKIIEVIKKYNLNIDRFLEYLHYLQHEYIDIMWVADHYGDYLEAEYFLRGRRKRKMDKYPKHLLYWHHIKTKELSAFKKQIDEENFKNICVAHKDYAWKKEDFCIVVPEYSEDLKREGSLLNHCVGTYVSKVAKEQTFIVFLRRTINPTEPYVTVEIKNNTLITAYAVENTKPDDDALDFLRKYVEEKHFDLDWCWGV